MDHLEDDCEEGVDSDEYGSGYWQCIVECANPNSKRMCQLTRTAHTDARYALRR